MPVTAELIAQFFRKQCNPAEAQAVADYLNANPAVLDGYLSESEWNREIEHDDRTAAFWEEIWQAIKPRTLRPARSYAFLKYGIAAAIVAGLVIFASVYFTRNNPVTQPQQQVASTFKHRVLQNTSGAVMELRLTDGSTVTLAPAARLEYDEPFQHNRRDILLEGAAVFKVAKDKTRPFTVYSGGLATTALGTQFKITALPNTSKTVVALYEGKIVVKPVDKALKSKHSYYLYPGDALTYNKLTAAFNLTRKQVKAGKQQGQLLVFDKVSLADVFDRLASTYSVHIQYANSDFEKVYYIGSFDQTDSIQHILENIVKVNGLKLVRPTDNEYIITR